MWGQSCFIVCISSFRMGLCGCFVERMHLHVHMCSYVLAYACVYVVSAPVDLVTTLVNFEGV